MRSLLLLALLVAAAAAVDLTHVNAKSLSDHNDSGKPVSSSKLNCIKDIGVPALDSVRAVKPYYQIFLIDLTTPPETFHRIRLMFVQAVCLYAAAANHIRIGYIAFVNQKKVSSEPSIPDIREFIGQWTEPDDKLLEGVAVNRSETPLTHCEKAEILAGVIDSFKSLTSKPFRFFIIDDQGSSQAKAGPVDNCDMGFEFGKALWRRNISLDRFMLDEAVSRDQDHDSGRRVAKEPVFTMNSLDDTQEFMEGMKTYVNSLSQPGRWSNEALKNMILAEQERLGAEAGAAEEFSASVNDVVIEYKGEGDSKLGDEENMTNPEWEAQQRLAAEAAAAAAAATTIVALAPHDDNVPGAAPPSVNATAQENTSSPSSGEAEVASAADTAAAAAALLQKPTKQPLRLTTTFATTTAAAVAEAAINLLDWWVLVLIILGALIVGFLLFVIFCCWWEKRKLKTKVINGSKANSAQSTPLIGSRQQSDNTSSGSSNSRRPLRLTQDYQVSATPVTDSAVLVEQKGLAEPYSPVKFINTPVPMASEIEMTPHTEHVEPAAMDDGLKRNVVTPMEKLPELHIDEYNQ